MSKPRKQSITSPNVSKEMHRMSAFSPATRRSGRLSAFAAALACAALMVLSLGAVSSQAAFGLNGFDTTYANEDGSPATQAGSHPFAMTTGFMVNATEEEPFKFSIDGQVKDLLIEQAPGLAGDAASLPRCSNSDFFAEAEGSTALFSLARCADSTVVGVQAVNLEGTDLIWVSGPVYNLVPPVGSAARIGFTALGQRVVVDLKVKPGGDYNVIASLTNAPQAVRVFGSVLQLWGVPGDPRHDKLRGACGSELYFTFGEKFEGFTPSGSCSRPAGTGEKPFLTLPTSCEGPVATNYETDSWDQPGTWLTGGVVSHDNAVPPNPQGFTGCGKLGFEPTIEAAPTTKAAESPTGLDFSLDAQNEGLSNPKGLSESTIRKAVVTLPEGMTVNPSIAEGLATCTESDLSRETAGSQPGEGCPQASKIGTVEVESPLIDQPLSGALYAATQNQNPFHSLLALYMVIRNPQLGIIIKQPLKVDPDPRTGRLTTTAEDLPRLPFSHFRLHFREGTRSPLSSPPACGSYQVEAQLTPWSGTAPITSTSTFELISGSNSGPCPPGGVPPFRPGLDAGTVNNAAGSYSPFNLRLSRNDGEQEFTNFSIKLPPGIVGKLAGIPFCPDAAIAAARSRTGAEELASPSCPAASKVGRTLVGAGVGPALTYVPGSVYLAGPYNGSSLSIAAITSAKVGPFDVGTVVVREALKVNPETAEVFIDATGSDPIPHIIQGIPVHARDIRVYVDRPDFVLNPTSCKRTSTASTVLGSGLDFGSEADNEPITVTTPFQAASCASLGFKPKLSLRLIGGTRRGATPKFKAVVTARPGDANIGSAQVTLPHSAFLEQAHIRTVCTRVQYAAGAGNGTQCPAGSVYGYARAFTPLLDEPLEGPVFLRSSNHNLPDLVAALRNGKININLAGRIDSVNGRIRNSFEAVPDAPVTRFVLEMQGGRKGLIVNSTDICKAKNQAVSHFVGQNGKVYDTRPVVRGKCGKGGRTPARAAVSSR